VRHTQFISQAVASVKVQKDKSKDKRLRALGEVERKFIKAEEEKWLTST
jgi:truncated hemoglobin YjbI